MGFGEALRRLARVFPRGSAAKDIERRKADRLKLGELDARAEDGVVDELARELIDGRGVGSGLLAADPSFESPMLLAAE